MVVVTREWRAASSSSSSSSSRRAEESVEDRNMFHDSKGPVTSRHTLEGEKKKFVRWFSLCDSPSSSCCCIVPLLLQVPSAPALEFSGTAANLFWLLVLFVFVCLHTYMLFGSFQKFVRWFSLCRLVAYCCSFSPSWIFRNGCSFVLSFALFFFWFSLHTYIDPYILCLFVFFSFFNFPWIWGRGGGFCAPDEEDCVFFRLI